jgi:hypothetical protein
LSRIFEKVRTLISAGDVRISEHGYDELVEDGLSAREVLGGVQEAILVEEYPGFAKGPCALFCRKIEWGCQSMLYGASQKVMKSPWCWLQPIARIPCAGMKRLRKGGADESEKKVKICS